ncbi:MAG: DUF4258 domain-containing protein [Anaerolineae bacterium]
MGLLQDIQAEVRRAGLSLTLHAQQQMTSRRIAVGEAREALLSADAEVIEDYPGDPRGPSCLVYGQAGGRVLHVHVSHPPGIVVITMYEPDPDKWEVDLRTRK